VTPPLSPLAAQIRAALAPGRFERLGVAVSGGSDSLALLHLLADWAAEARARLQVVSVDHGLRPQSAAEARGVAQAAEALGLPHRTLQWQGWDGRGNLMQEARRARYRLMREWAQAEGIGAIALGHTADDQAETFLMRLARGAGVDGLSAMAPERREAGVLWLRPLLAMRREALRDWLRARGISHWVEDPSNEDPAYERIRARAVLAALAPLGIDAPTIADVTGHLREVRAALAVQTEAAARHLIGFQGGDLVFDREAYGALPSETRRRLLVHALRWIAGAEHGPRGPALAAFAQAVQGARPAMLHGCIALPEGPLVRLCREAAASGGAVAAGEIWDGRWRLFGPARTEDRVACLGEAGLKNCPDWRRLGRPRAAVLADPAVWRGEALLAAPLAGLANGWHAELLRTADDLFGSILEH
jgi:tRNA(Ile)-lysidine synthase